MSAEGRGKGGVGPDASPYARRFASFQRLAHVGTWELDLETDVSWWSEETYRILEIDPATPPSHEAFTSVVHPDDRALVEEAYRDCRERGVGYDMVHRLLLSDGRVKYVHALGQPQSEDHRVVRFIGTIQDVTLHEQQHRRFRSLIEHSSDLILLVDSAGRLEFANRAVEAVLGVRIDDWKGRRLHDLLAPEDALAFDAFLEQAIRAPAKVLPWQVRVRAAAGVDRWLEGTGTSYVDDRALRGVVINFRDVSEHRLAEEALRQSEELLRQAVLVSDVGIFDHDLIANAIFWSPRQRAIHGWGAQESVSLSDVGRLAHPEDAARVVEHIRRSHDPAGDGLLEMDYRICRRDGTVRWLACRARTFFQGEGAARRAMRTVGVVRDQTESKVLEQSMRLKDRAIVTSLNAIAITDADARIIYVNPAFVRMWGYDAESEILGRRPTDLAESGPASDMMTALLRDGRYQGELVAVRKDGTRFDVMLLSHTLTDADGRPTNLIGSFVDISESKRLQAQLLQSQKMESVGRLAGGVAHDFNNLLTVMQGYLELVLATMNASDPLRADLLEVSAAADSASALTQQLLAFSRKQIIKPQVLDLNAILDRVQRMLARLLGEDVELKIVRAEGLWPVRFDPGQSEQILINLAVNARDAMQGSGKLLLETANVTLDEDYARTHAGCIPGDYVMLAVSDDGAGMNESVKRHVFEPFFTTKEMGAGTGLGLAMVYGAVSQNGGVIEVYSEVGEGTTFKIYLPRVQAPTSPVEAPPRAPLPRGTETIVLVEDEDSVRQLAIRLLELSGYRVHAFVDGPSAVEGLRATSEPIHLLVTDVVMPGMNGRDLANRLAAMRPGLRVLYTSGYTANVIVQHGVLAEGVEFLSKPYTLETLSKRVREVLDGAPAARP